MRTKNILKYVLIITCLLSNLDLYAQNATPVTIYIREAGKLHTYIADSEKYKITNLIIVGYLNRDDLRYLKDMAGNSYNGIDFTGTSETPCKTEGRLAILDLTDAKINSGDLLFSHCQSLTTIILPNDLYTINDYAFAFCSNLKNVTAAKVTTIGWGAFYSCTGLTNSLIIPNNVYTIKPAAFQKCTGLSSIYIPDNVRTIEGGAFSYCTNLKEFIVSSQNYNYTAIDGILLSKDSKTLVTYPAGEKKHSIPEGITVIGKSAFSGCENITSIIIPKTVKTIEGEAFANCKNLKEIYINNPVPPKCYSTAVFCEVAMSSCFLYVPKGSYNTYWFDNIWGNFKIIESDFTTSNEEIIVAREIDVYSDEGILFIESSKDSFVSIYDIGGKLVKRVKIQGKQQVILNNGVYIVASGDFVKKVWIK